jgi:hypothetical protein
MMVLGGHLNLSAVYVKDEVSTPFGITAVRAVGT